ncbi:MAG: M67 family metallopeptidase [Anaerolineae bacterium]|nr:M67 family metallopeptidase [Anaerolineae bacterium]
MRIHSQALRQIARHAAAEYPAECCGLLVGRGDEVRTASAVRNLLGGERCDRFELDPVGHVQVWERAHANGEDVIGCYHSHPDGQAQPSSIDRRLARGFGGPFGYLVVAVDGESGSCEVFAGQIQEDGEIIPVPLEVIEGTDASSGGAGSGSCAAGAGGAAATA